MQTLTQALIELTIAGLVDRETATNAAPNAHDFEIALAHAEKALAAEAAEKARAEARGRAETDGEEPDGADWRDLLGRGQPAGAT